MSALFTFALREAASDVADLKLLGEEAAAFPIEIDYLVPAGGTLAIVDTFLTTPPLPGAGLWPSGQWFVGLEVAQATEISFTVELWRADLNANDIAIVGSRPAASTGIGPIGFTILTAALDPVVNPAFSTTDRLKLKVFAANLDGVNAQTLGILASASGVQTLIERTDKATNNFNMFRRGRFLGYLFRPGEGAPYFDEHGVNLDAALDD